MRRMLPKQPRAVITGAGGGLGRALALRLAERSAQLLLSDIDAAGLEETQRLAEAGGATKVQAVACDVSKPAEVEQLSQTARSTLGDVDLLINNAGVAVGGAVGSIPLSDWEWIVGINLWGVIYGCHYFLPAMKQRNAGHVLNVASIAAFASAAEMAPYNVTKAGVVALSETLASELASTKVGVTVLCPFFFTTNIAKNARTSAAVKTETIEKVMSRSNVQAADVAKLALAACDKRKLYAFPHREAKTIALIKRTAPATLHQSLAPWMSKFV